MTTSRSSAPQPLPTVPADIQAQLDTLRHFNRKVDHLERTGFAVRYAEEVPQVMARFDDVSFEDHGGGKLSMTGRVHSWLQDFSQDEIDAFVLTYRLFTQRNDRISLHSLSGIYASGWMPAEAREYFESARSEVKDYLERAATIMFGEYHISIAGIVDVVVYGGMAHSNREKSEIFDAWSSSGFMGFIWAEFFAYARFMIRILRQIRDLNLHLLTALDDGTAWFIEGESE